MTLKVVPPMLNAGKPVHDLAAAKDFWPVCEDRSVNVHKVRAQRTAENGQKANAAVEDRG
jgi:hypothetical protein